MKHTHRHYDTEICCFESQHIEGAISYYSCCKLFQCRLISPPMVCCSQKLPCCPPS